MPEVDVKSYVRKGRLVRKYRRHFHPADLIIHPGEARPNVEHSTAGLVPRVVRSGGSGVDLSNVHLPRITNVEDEALEEYRRQCSYFGIAMNVSTWAEAQAEMKTIDKKALGNVPEDVKTGKAFNEKDILDQAQRVMYAQNAYADALEDEIKNHSDEIDFGSRFYLMAAHRLRKVQHEMVDPIKGELPWESILAIAALASPGRRWPTNGDRWKGDNVDVVIRVAHDWIHYGRLGHPIGTDQPIWQRNPKTGEIVRDENGNPVVRTYKTGKRAGEPVVGSYIEDYSVRYHLPDFIEHATRIMQGDVESVYPKSDVSLPRETFGGRSFDSRKTRNFFLNLSGNQDAVTIDRHMLDLAYRPIGVIHKQGQPETGFLDEVKPPRPGGAAIASLQPTKYGYETRSTDRGYIAAEIAVRRMADELGWTPAATQAVLWDYVQQHIKGINLRASEDDEGPGFFDILYDGDIQEMVDAIEEAMHRVDAPDLQADEIGVKSYIRDGHPVRSYRRHIVRKVAEYMAPTVTDADIRKALHTMIDAGQGGVPVTDKLVQEVRDQFPALHRVFYLSGAARPGMQGLHPDLGFLMTPNPGTRRPTPSIWAADNGLFGQQSVTYSDERYLSWLGKQQNRDGCIFANAPDVVIVDPDTGVVVRGDPVATLRRARPMLPKIRELGYRASLVAQDGLRPTPEGVVASDETGIERMSWDDFDALFIGGTDNWKLNTECRDLMAEAKARGKWVHVGRVNSEKRMVMAAIAGADSVDGNTIGRGPDKNLPRVMKWLEAATTIIDRIRAGDRVIPYGRLRDYIEPIRTSHRRPKIEPLFAAEGGDDQEAFEAYVDSVMAEIEAEYEKITSWYSGMNMAEDLFLDDLFEGKHPRGHGGKFVRKYTTLFKLIRESGGFSYQPFEGREPVKGFMVSLHPEFEMAKPVDEITEEDVHRYISANWDLFKSDPDLFFGAWEADGKVFLDISSRIPTRAQAERLARWNSQLAIWDLEAGNEIPTLTQEEAKRAERIARIQGIRATEAGPSGAPEGGLHGPEDDGEAALPGDQEGDWFTGLGEAEALFLVDTDFERLHPRGRHGQWIDKLLGLDLDMRPLMDEAGVDKEYQDYVLNDKGFKNWETGEVHYRLGHDFPQTLVGAMRLWRSGFQYSSNMRRYLEGKELAPAFQDDTMLKTEALTIREGLRRASPVDIPTYRSTWQQFKVGDEVNMAADSVAFDRYEAEGYTFDDMGIGQASAAKGYLPTMLVFPPETKGIRYDRLDLLRRGEKKKGAIMDDYESREAIVQGRFRVASVETVDADPTPMGGLRSMSQKYNLVTLERVDDYWDPPVEQMRLPDEVPGEGWNVGVFYHVTPTGRVEKIMEHGIRPRSEGVEPNPHFAQYTMDDRGVYLFPSRAAAEEWKKYMEMRDKNTGTSQERQVLRVDGIDQAQLWPDPEALREWIIRPWETDGKSAISDIEKERAKILDDARWHPDPVNHPEGQTLREWLDEQGLKGKLYPYMIKGPSDPSPEWFQEDPWKDVRDVIDSMPRQLRVDTARAFSEHGLAVIYRGTAYPSYDQMQLPEPAQEHVPLPPGETPIPEGWIRLYHYTDTKEQLDSIVKNGLTMKSAKGSTYGEPNAVWASGQMPKVGIKYFVELAVPPDFPGWDIGKPEPWRPGYSPDEYQKYGRDVTFMADIPPEYIVAAHEPWHQAYHYMAQEKDLSTFDWLDNEPADSPEYGPYKRALAILRAERAPKQLDGKDWNAETGNPDHLSRTEQGMIPTSAIANLGGVKGEVPGEHRNRLDANWEAFLEDIRQNGIQEPIHITVDYGEPPKIAEGNHRRDAAVELGLKEVPVTISYYGNAQQQGTVVERSQRVGELRPNGLPENLNDITFPWLEANLHGLTDSALDILELHFHPTLNGDPTLYRMVKNEQDRRERLDPALEGINRELKVLADDARDSIAKITGRPSRWNGDIKVVLDSGGLKDWGCWIEVGRRLADPNTAYPSGTWQADLSNEEREIMRLHVVIHELTHSFSNSHPTFPEFDAWSRRPENRFSIARQVAVQAMMDRSEDDEVTLAKALFVETREWEEGLVEMFARSHFDEIRGMMTGDLVPRGPSKDLQKKWAKGHSYSPWVNFFHAQARAAGMSDADFSREMLQTPSTDRAQHLYDLLREHAEKGGMNDQKFIEACMKKLEHQTIFGRGKDRTDLAGWIVREDPEWWRNTFGVEMKESFYNWVNGPEGKRGHSGDYDFAGVVPGFSDLWWSRDRRLARIQEKGTRRSRLKEAMTGGVR